MYVTVAIQHPQKGKISVTLSAKKLLERKLPCEITGEVDVKEFNGNIYTTEAVRLLCGSGMAYARRKVGCEAGLQIEVQDVQGTVDRSDDVAICHATTIAIARSLNCDDSELVNAIEDWILIDEDELKT